MDNYYRQAIAKAEAQDAWQRGPVAFESCWDMRKWHDEGWDIPAIFDYALDLHASYENNKSAPLPEGSREHVERFLRKVGYRLVPRRVTYGASVGAGQDLAVSIHWENVGVAPPYWDYYPAVRLVPEGRGEPVVTVAEGSVRGWLPGELQSIEALIPTRGLAAGACALQIGIVGPDGQTPAVRLPIAGRTDDGWYAVGRSQTGG